MTWKVIAISDAGTASKFGGDDLDKVNKGFAGIDVDDYDINADWKFRSGKLNIRNAANTFSYNVIGAALAADRTLNLPLLTATDTVAVTGLAQTLSNKTLDSTCVVNDANLSANIVKENAANDFGDFDNSFKDNRIRIWNPADTFRYTIIGGAIAANRNASLPVLTADDSFAFINQTQTFTNKTINSGYDYGQPANNIIRGTGCDNPYAGSPTGPVVRRTGLFAANGATEASGFVGGSFTAIGTNSSMKNTTEGFGQDYDTTAVANANAGIRQGATRWRREWGCYCIGRIKISSTSDVRAFIGWSSDTAEIAGETTLNNFSGFGIGKRAADINWFTMRNDGDATEDRVDTTIAQTTSFLTFEMQLDATNFQSKIDGVAQTTQTTELPASATDLTFHCEIETGAGAASKTLSIMPIFFRCG